MSSSLQNLPAELLGRIAEHAEDDICNLRLTCREIDAKTKYQFADTCFREIGVFIEPDGFDTLLEIAQHAEFGPHVRRLNLDPEFLVSPDVEWDEEPEEGRPVFEPTIQDYVEGGAFRKDLLQSVQALANLECIWIAQPNLQGAFTDADAGMLRRYWEMILETTLSVIEEQKLHLRQWKVHRPFSPHCPPRIGILDSISKKPELFDRMTKLGFQLKLEGYDDPAAACTSLVKILGCTKELQKLSLTLDGSIVSGVPLVELSRHTDIFPNLQTLTLSQILISSNDFIAFLNICREKLRTLKLMEVVLVSESWKDVFNFCAENMHLKRVWFLTLYEDSSVVTFEPFHAKRPIIKENYWMYDILYGRNERTRDVYDMDIDGDEFEDEDDDDEGEEEEETEDEEEIDEEELLERRKRRMDDIIKKGQERERLLYADASEDGGEDLKERDFLKSFAYVTRDNNYVLLSMRDGDGEDIREWLSILADTYGLFLPEEWPMVY